MPAGRCHAKAAHGSLAHGDPALHAVEIYKGRPIFYGLGNFIFEPVNESVSSLDVYGPLAYMSVVAHAEFRSGRLTALRFQPIVLSLDNAGQARRGVPYLAEGGEAALILGRLAEVSHRYGTEMRIAGESASVVIANKR